MALVFSLFTLRTLSSHKFSCTFIRLFVSTSVRDISTSSSVYIRKRIMAWVTLGDLMPSSVVSHCTISSSSLMHNLKSVGNSEYPSLTPMSLEKRVDFCPLILSTHLTVSYILAFVVLYYVGTPSFSIISHSLSHGILSKAFLKSIKQKRVICPLAYFLPS